MTDEPRDKFHGETMSAVISQVPSVLPIDAVGLWHIVPKGRDGFGLTGDALDQFVRRCIYALLAAGAVPVSTGQGTGYEWIAQKQYGSTEEEIADNVIREWREEPDESEIIYKVWFALPDPAFPKYVKLE